MKPVEISQLLLVACFCRRLIEGTLKGSSESTGPFVLGCVHKVGRIPLEIVSRINAFEPRVPRAASGSMPSSNRARDSHPIPRSQSIALR